MRRLCGVEVEDALHLWAASPVTQCLEDGGGGSARDPVTWSPSQLCKFLGANYCKVDGPGWVGTSWESTIVKWGGPRCFINLTLL